jgi:hypothetical protein
MNDTLTDSEVVARAANALATSRQCFGHGKASRCEESFRYWKELAQSRGVCIPSDEQLAQIGTFNGPGAA